jgi:prepilin-type N-terminal cleavage/methylation domain-containing protein
MKRSRENPAVTRRREGGFTLVELLVAMGIFGILATIAAATFRITLETRERAILKIRIAENARTTLDFMAEELRSAYLTPESVAPVIRGQEDAPRLRLAAIHRDRAVTPKPARVGPTSQWTPGAGEDEDGDGRIDEEWLDGLDNDYTPTAVNKPWSYLPERADGQVDEDIGMFPSDRLYFVTAQQDTLGGPTVLTEVAYGLNSVGTRLIRYARKAEENEDALYVGKFLVNRGQPGGQRFLPTPLATQDVGGEIIPNTGYQPRILALVHQTWDEFADDVMDGSSNDRQISSFEILAYDIRGLRIRYWYYDYNQDGWRVTQEWDSARETLLFDRAVRIFDGSIPGLSADVATNDRARYVFPIANEPTDAFPRDPLGMILADLRGTPQQPGVGRLLSDPAFEPLGNRINSATDGLPWVIEIELYVQDEAHSFSPQRFTTRVHVPNNNIPPPRTTGGVTS